ncbi:hypothetical protein EK904_004939 [Melospiza melodia maxima]|nr:hypothetical protein EK904_004939 [Melospiza melodia maxima]
MWHPASVGSLAPEIIVPQSWRRAKRSRASLRGTDQRRDQLLVKNNPSLCSPPHPQTRLALAPSTGTSARIT